MKPSFREAFRSRRGLIPADGFYEWKTEGKVKQPHYISLKSGEPLAMAGLWESWRHPDGSILRTCCIITTTPNALIEPIHDRMPVIIGPEQWHAWFTGSPEEVRDMLAPYAPEEMQAWPVNRRVTRALEEDGGLIDPMEGNALT